MIAIYISKNNCKGDRVFDETSFIYTTEEWIVNPLDTKIKYKNTPIYPLPKKV